MTSTQPLLYAAPSAFTIERVRTLVQQVGPEAPTVEYKEKLGPTLARGVAALANTYGGLLLVGVSDQRKITGVKEKTIEAVAEHCAAKIEPPWTPEIIPVPLGDDSDLYVLVLRIVPGTYPRPLLVDGVAYVRHQNTTHPADWHRLGQLFAEQAAASEEVWDLQAPQIPQQPGGGTDEAVDFVLRSGISLPVAAAKWRPLSERAVTSLADVLDGSRLAHVMAAMAPGPSNTTVTTGFRRAGLNRSRSVRLAWSACPDTWPAHRPRPVEAQAALEIPGGYGTFGQRLTLQVDVTVRTSTMAVGLPRAPAHRPVTLLETAHLIDALAEALTSPELVAALAELAGVDAYAVTQPRNLHLVTARPLSSVLDTAALTAIRGAGTSHGAHLLADPARDLADPAQRWTQVLQWIEQIALDGGLTGAERLLQHLTAPSPGPGR
ncbi:helix-turn-helix domain-containing protein [Kitasatospora sp. MBT66]|uniref:AlbA family DNA-binding domain-containing protein n=1 Tax=Kitasatospora sp. MBT66 TaxID=1444769 RepID=UPI0006925EE1|nr:ATP-binding protein [Kitasatospora sp. MBT66]